MVNPQDDRKAFPVQPARADARLNRSRVIEAARALFSERGAEVDMKEVADRAGVGVGTLYRNFPTKNDLIAAVLDEALESLRAVIEEALAVEDPREGLRLFIHGACDVIEQSGFLIRVLLEAAIQHRLAHPDFASFTDRFDALIVRGIDSGVFRSDVDPRIAAANLKALLFPLPYLDLREQLSREEIAEGYTSLALGGILPPNAQAAPA